jgi:hypothetical protein
VSETTSAPVTLSLFVGEGHVLVAVNDAWRERFGEPLLGVPVSEGYADPVWKPVQDLMTSVYRSGVGASMRWADGLVVIDPLTVCGSRGVGAAWQPAAPRTPGASLTGQRVPARA